MAFIWNCKTLSIGNVDIWVGGMAEDPVNGAKVGPTFQCLLAEQFRRLRDGDRLIEFLFEYYNNWIIVNWLFRFWYENPGVFKPEQLTQIKQSTLSRVICDSSDDILEVTKNVFKMPNLQSPSFVGCSQIPKVDLRFWAECCHGNFVNILRVHINRNEVQYVTHLNLIVFQNAAVLVNSTLSLADKAGQSALWNTRIPKINLRTEKRQSCRFRRRLRIVFTTILSPAMRNSFRLADECWTPKSSINRPFKRNNRMNESKD